MFILMGMGGGALVAAAVYHFMFRGAGLKASMQEASFAALDQISKQLVQLNQESLSKQTQAGAQELEGKKQLIDQRLNQLGQQLEAAQTLMRSLEKDRENKFAELTKQISHTALQTEKLQHTAQDLRAALANTRVRGQWGERMAEDVLRMAGFIEGTNYIKQGTTASGSRPDFTFMLPQDRKVHMDVKFPLDNYLAYLEADAEVDKDRYKQMFLKDARLRVAEASKREYVDETQGTLAYVLVFIPNEQVYSFLNEHDRGLLDESLQKRVILCSPVTLYAVLAVIRQAVDNFQLGKTAQEILQLLSDFQKQWGKFQEAMDTVGSRLESTRKAYDDMATTRSNQLERPLRKIDALRLPSIDDDNPAPLHLVAPNKEV